MTDALREAAVSNADGSIYWRRNLAVCVFGSITTLVAMTLLLPFLPLYVEELGVRDRAGIVWWSGVAFGATFLAAGLVAPLWGRLADRYGRKLMLVRASLGMAIAMSLLGMAHDVWQLVALRLLAGLLGGYASASTVLVATQTPKARTGWALGVLSSGIMTGSLIGPLIGGAFPALIGIRSTFFLAGGVIFAAFVATALFVKEQPRPVRVLKPSGHRAGSVLTRPLVTMLLTGTLVMLATMSIEPIITIYVAQFVSARQVTLVAGIVMSAGALGSVISAPFLGKLADRVGPIKVLIGCLAAAAILLVPQALVTTSWQLVALRLLMGMALGGMLPCIASVIRHAAAEAVAGTVLGYSVSAQYVGNVTGPLLGAAIGAHSGMRAVFFATSAVMAIGAIANGIVFRRRL